MGPDADIASVSISPRNGEQRDGGRTSTCPKLSSTMVLLNTLTAFGWYGSKASLVSPVLMNVGCPASSVFGEALNRCRC